MRHKQTNTEKKYKTRKKQMNELLYKELVDPNKSFEENRKCLLKFLGRQNDDISIKNYDELLKLFHKDTIGNYEVASSGRTSSINRGVKVLQETA